jgi:cation diffusion facilitator family transporter
LPRVIQGEQHPVTGLRTPERAALLGLLINAALAAGKLVAGVVGHSFALVADSVESMVDIAGSAVIWGALRYGGRPPDEEHPFGHGKAESLAALAVACVIIIAGVGIAAEAIRQIMTPQRGPRAFTLVVLIGVVLVKEILFRVSHRAAHEAGSSAGRADAWHHRSDAITSAFAFVGISVSLLGGPGWAQADDWAALAASFVIVFNGVRLVREPYAELMDRNDDVLAARCREIALATDGVEDVERSEARKMGRVYRVVMHVEVDPEMSVRASHALTGKIKARIREEEGRVTSVLIHIEPHNDASPADAREDVQKRDGS